MSEQIPIFAYNHELPEPPALPPQQEPAMVHAMAPPTPEQTRAVEAAFTRDENANVAALLGFWTSAMIVNDLMQDAAEELDRSDMQPKRKPGRDTH
jgi:hypothetical protein